MSGGDGRRGAAIAVVSTVVFFAVLALLITHAPGWPEVRRTFFDWDQFKAAMDLGATPRISPPKRSCVRSHGSR